MSELDAPRSRTVELVRARGGTWVPAPTRRRPVARAVRVWLRECFTPADPASYLGPRELCLIRTRLHWVVPLKRIAQGAVMMPLAIALTLLFTFLLPSVWWLQVAMWLATVAHQLWIVYQVVAWRVKEVIVTDRRLILVHGVFTSTVDAVNLTKITDTSYRQSFLGHVFNYGSLRIETSGQAQAIERLDFVPAPVDVYQATLA